MVVGVVAIIGVVIVGVAIAAAIALRSDGDDSTFEYNGVALPTFTGEGADPAFGLKAPIVVTEDFDGNRLVVGSGSPNDPTTVFGLFAHWCPTCQAELPPIAHWLRENQLPDGVQVVAVSTFEDSGRDNHPPGDWFSSVDWPTTVLVDTGDDDIMELFGMEGVPGWVVLDEFNRVIHRETGPIGVDGFAALVNAAAEQVGG